MVSKYVVFVVEMFCLFCGLRENKLAIFAILLNARVDLYAYVQLYARILFRKILHRSKLFAPSDETVISVLIDIATLCKVLLYPFNSDERYMFSYPVNVSSYLTH
jgi:hypothetical protein